MSKNDNALAVMRDAIALGDSQVRQQGIAKLLWQEKVVKSPDVLMSLFQQVQELTANVDVTSGKRIGANRKQAGAYSQAATCIATLTAAVKCPPDSPLYGQYWDSVFAHTARLVRHTPRTLWNNADANAKATIRGILDVLRFAGSEAIRHVDTGMQDAVSKLEAARQAKIDETAAKLAAKEAAQVEAAQTATVPAIPVTK